MSAYIENVHIIGSHGTFVMSVVVGDSRATVMVYPRWPDSIIVTGSGLRNSAPVEQVRHVVRHALAR